VGATLDKYFRAFETSTGKEVWSYRLPYAGHATPMSYQGSDGRQYVVIAAGGHGALMSEPGDAIVAFALPAKK
jgi:quinoprotein glucose dehydrogenase